MRMSNRNKNVEVRNNYCFSECSSMELFFGFFMAAASSLRWLAVQGLSHKSHLVYRFMLTTTLILINILWYVMRPCYLLGCISEVGPCFRTCKGKSFTEETSCPQRKRQRRRKRSTRNRQRELSSHGPEVSSASREKHLTRGFFVAGAKLVLPVGQRASKIKVVRRGGSC